MVVDIDNCASKSSIGGVTNQTWQLFVFTGATILSSPALVVYSTSTITAGTGSISQNLIPANCFIFGADCDGNNTLNGNIARIFLWNRLLTTTEINGLYAQTLIPTSGLVSDWNPV